MNNRNNMSYPKVSVITVVYNDHLHIEQTLLSVLNQTYDNIEYIVVDGGSVDGTIEIIQQYEDRITKFKSEPDKGIYDAMNKGIALSTGEWINFMNAGDIFVNDSVLEDIFNNKISSECKLIYGDVLMDYGQNQRIVRKFNNIEDILIPFYLCHQSTLTNGDYLRENYYDTTFKICADANSFYDIQKKGGKMKYVSLPISVYEAYEGISSRNLYKSYLEQSKIRSLKYYSWGFIQGYVKVVVKSLLSKILSQKTYARFMKWYIKKVD